MLTEDKQETIKDEFHEQLERTLEGITKQDMQMICGEFNTKIGKESDPEANFELVVA